MSVKKGFYALLLIQAGVILWTFWDYGITPDEGHHVAYGGSVVAWYTSGFVERRMFSWADVWLYGGFYDTLVHLVTQISPLDLYDTRHLCNAFVGLLGVVVAYYVGALFGSPWIGLLAGLFLLLTPRYYGHAFNNNKDIPFAVLYLSSLYWQMKVLTDLPRVPWRWIVVTGLVTGLAMGIRVGGVLLVGYAGLFWGVAYFFIWRRAGEDFSQVFKDYVLRVALMFGVAYGVMLIFWPWAQTDPLRHPWQALTVFSQFPGGHLNFFEGTHLHSYEIPWYYAPKWLLMTLPEFILIGLACLGAFLFVRSDMRHLRTGFLAFAACFPLFYLMIAGTPLYNATRHFMFVVPPIVVLSGIGIHGVLVLLVGRWRMALGCVVVGLVFVTAWDMVRLHPFQTVFFNRLIAGGLAQASSAYDTDNYHNGYKQGVLWLRQFSESNGEQQIRVYGGAGLNEMLDLDRFEVEEGVPWRADYYLTTTNMRLHTVMPGDVVHTVSRMGVPLLYVIRPDTTRQSDPLFATDVYPFRDVMWGQWYQAEERWDDALCMYEKALQTDGKSSDVYRLMGEVYHAQENYDQAAMFYRRAIDAGAHVVTTGTKLADALLEMQDFEKAIPYYEHAIARRPNYMGALMGLGRAFFSLQRYEEAIVPLEKVIRLAYYEPIHFQRLGLVYLQAGRTNEAIENFKKAVEIDPNGMLAWYHLGLALEESGHSDQAERVYLEALNFDPNRTDILLRLASLYYASENYEAAVRVLVRVLEHDSRSVTAYYLLGQIYEAMVDLPIAVRAYESVLRLDPGHMHAKERLAHLKNKQE